MTGSSRVYRAAGFAVGVAVAAAVGCGAQDAVRKTEAPAGASSRARVSVVHPERKTIRRTVTQPGQIEAFDQARLYVKIPGYVERYLVDIGDKVTGPRVDGSGNVMERGQLLAVLSAPEIDQDLVQKKSLVAQANADIEQSQATVKAAQADVASAQARLNETTAAIDRFEAEYQRWSSEYARVAELVTRSAVTQKLADETKAQMMAAAAARSEAQAKVESARALVSASQAQVEKSRAEEAAIRARRQVAEADEARAAAMVNYLRIEAPFDGTVTQRHADIGSFAQASGGDSAPPLFTVVRIDPVRVFLDVPELDAPLVDPGDAAVVRVQSLAGRNFRGAVTRSAWSLDATTRTLHTEVDIANSEGVLRPGMYAQVTIELAERENVLVLPPAAVVEHDGATVCYVAESGRAARRNVTVGLKTPAELEIVDGLADGESVVVIKGGGLADGQEIDVIEPGR